MSNTELGRLRWRCRRGMRELDAVLMRFLDTGYTGLSASEKRAFAAILEWPDPDIHAYLLGRLQTEDVDVATVIAAIRRSVGSAA